MIKKKWHYRPLPEAEKVARLGKILKTPSLITKLLLQREINSLHLARTFFNPSIEVLHDPSLMMGMTEAVERIGKAIDKKEKIIVYGDYDVDGTTSVALLYSILKELGAHQVSFYIPSRQEEGYGLSQKGIAHAVQEKVSLLICVDCGTRAVAQIRRAKEHRIDTIVCDHHEPGEELPPTIALLNPKQKGCSYPFQGLSACGVIYKLAQALLSHRKVSSIDLTAYLDLVALSIAADITSVKDEGRILLAHGLTRIEEGARPGIIALKRGLREKDKLTVSDIVLLPSTQDQCRRGEWSMPRPPSDFSLQKIPRRQKNMPIT